MSLHDRIARTNIWLGDVASLAFPFAFVLTTVEVVSRYFFDRPTSWTLEIALLTSAVAYILTGPQATAYDSHIRIDLLTRAMSPGWRRRARWFADLMTAAFGAVIVYAGTRLAMPLLDGIETTGSALNTPTPTIIKILIPVAGLLIAIQAFLRVVRRSPSDASPGER